MSEWEKLEDAYEERAAILEYDAGYSTYAAEQRAAQGMGFANKSKFKRHIQELKARAAND